MLSKARWKGRVADTGPINTGDIIGITDPLQLYGSPSYFTDA